MRRTVLRRLAACAVLVTSLATAAHAQLSAFQDAGGDSSVFLREGGGFAQVNPTDKSIKLGFLRDTGGRKPWFGIDFTGKASGGFASLFKGGTPSPEAEIGVTVGKRFVTMKSDEAIILDCEKKTAEELKTINFDTLAGQARQDFIDERKAKLLKDFQKQLDEVNVEKLTTEIWQQRFAVAKAKGMTDAVAAGIATAETPKLVGAKLEELNLSDLEKRAEEQARKEAALLTSEQLRALAFDSAIGEASNLCAEEAPELERSTYDWISFRASYKRARYKLLNTAGAFADQIRKQNFDGFSATFAYNRLLTLDNLTAERARRAARREARRNNRPAPEVERPKDFQSKGSMIIGFSVGVERKNNSDDLDSTDVEDQTFTSSSGTTQRRAIEKQTVLSGEYKEFIAVPVNTDVVWYPGRFGSRIAIDFFTRSNVGLFLTKEKSPTKVVGGISFSVDDGKGKVGLVGGFHF